MVNPRLPLLTDKSTLHTTELHTGTCHGVSLDNLGVSVFRHIGIRGCSEMPV